MRVSSAAFALCDRKFNPANENAAASVLVELVGRVGDDGTTLARLLVEALFDACFFDTASCRLFARAFSCVRIKDASPLRKRAPSSVSSLSIF